MASIKHIWNEWFSIKNPYSLINHIRALGFKNGIRYKRISDYYAKYPERVPGFIALVRQNVSSVIADKMQTHYDEWKNKNLTKIIKTKL